MNDERIGEIVRKLDDIERRFGEAFPGGDHRGHCRYHEIMIEQLEERRRLRRAVLEKSISGIVWGALVGLGIAIWQWIKHEVRG